MEKQCTRCKKLFPATTIYFYVNELGKDQLSSRCKKCIIEVAKTNSPKNVENKKRWYLNNRDKMKEYSHKHYLDNKEHYRELNKTWKEKNKDKIKRWFEQYYQNNRDYLLEYHRQFYKENKDQLAPLYKEYKQKNKKRINLYNIEFRKTHDMSIPDARRKHRRRIVEKNAMTTLTKIQWQKSIEYFDNQCVYCGSKQDKLTMDHYMPVSKGGDLSVYNIVPCCTSCNSSKHKHDFIDWYGEQLFYDVEKEKNINEYLLLMQIGYGMEGING